MILVKTFAMATTTKAIEKIRYWKMFFPQTRCLMTKEKYLQTTSFFLRFFQIEFPITLGKILLQSFC